MHETDVPGRLLSSALSLSFHAFLEGIRTIVYWGEPELNKVTEDLKTLHDEGFLHL